TGDRQPGGDRAGRQDDVLGGDGGVGLAGDLDFAALGEGAAAANDLDAVALEEPADAARQLLDDLLPPLDDLPEVEGDVVGQDAVVGRVAHRRQDFGR